MEQREYWNRAAAEKEFTTPLNLEVFKRHVPLSAEILDIGCGYGRTLEELRRNGYAKLTGVDFSEAMIARGRRQYPGLRLEVTRGGRLDFPDAGFDAVILFAVLTCIVDDAGQLALLGEAARLLKPGGIVCVSDFLLNTDARNVERYQKYAGKYGTYGVFELPEGAVLRHHSPEWVERCLKRFETITYETVGITTMNGNRANGYAFIGRRRMDVE